MPRPDKKGIRQCIYCKETYDDDFFVPYKGGYRNYCKKCDRTKASEWATANPERAKRNWSASGFKRSLRARGITVEIYNDLYERQAGCCAICGVHQSEVTRRLAIDHDHHTGTVRGLLCALCNFGIGSLHDSVDVLESAIRYLEAYDS